MLLALPCGIGLGNKQASSNERSITHRTLVKDQGRFEIRVSQILLHSLNNAAVQSPTFALLPPNNILHFVNRSEQYLGNNLLEYFMLMSLYNKIKIYFLFSSSSWSSCRTHIFISPLRSRWECLWQYQHKYSHFMSNLFWWISWRYRQHLRIIVLRTWGI